MVVFMHNAWRNWRRRASRVWRLSAGDWHLLLEAAVVLAAVRLALKRRSFERVLDSCTRLGSPLPAHEHSPRAIRRLARLVQVAADGHIFTMTCLPRSLALTRMLRRRGIPADLRLGLRRESGSLEGHAWVEWNGEPLVEAANPLQFYEPLHLQRVGERRDLERWSDA